MNATFFQAEYSNRTSLLFKSDLRVGFGVLLTSIFAQYSGLDIALANLIYHIFGDQFLTNNALLTEVFHQGGRYLVGLCITLFLIGFICTFVTNNSLQLLRPFFGYMLLSTVTCIVAIALLKNVTTLPCPWDTNLFGGTESYIGLFNAFESDRPIGHCYPSGHASGGFALFGLYVWATGTITFVRPSAKYLWLLPAILIGTTFAITQQLRGAHYLSHDLTTIGLCWIICVFIFRLFIDEFKSTARQVSK